MIPLKPIDVLIMDDDPHMLQLLEKHLVGAGYQVSTAGNGVEALNFLRSSGATLVLADWDMPVMDGLEFCRAVRSNDSFPFAHIIILSACAEENRVLDAFQAGADDFLAKPFNPLELLARVRAGQRILSLQQDLDRRNRVVHQNNAQIAIVNAKLAQANDRLKEMATTDGLTNLLNRREAHARLAEMWTSAVRHGDALTCMMIDIDHFKQINDTYGHSTGDQILREVAEVLSRFVRRDERVCRVGGEEFLVLCRRTTTLEAGRGAERLRRAVEDRFFAVEGRQLQVTVSIGVAERVAGMTSADDLLKVADERLYAAKAAGRNQVAVGFGRGAGPQAPASCDAGSMQAERPVEGSTLLWVSDDSQGALTHRDCLGELDLHLVVARDGEDAGERMDFIAPAAIVIDVKATRTVGLQIVRELKMRPLRRQVPIIIVGEREHAEHCLADPMNGPDEFIARPVIPAELVLRLQTIMRLRRELRQSNEIRGEQSRALGLLLDYSHNISAAASLELVLERTALAVVELTCCHAASILLPSAGHQHLKVVHSLGFDADVVRSIVPEMGKGVSGQVFASGQAMTIESPEELLQSQKGPDGLLFSSVPSVSAALCVSECVVGVLNLTQRQNLQPFSALELEYIDLIGNIAASAIHDCLTLRARDQARDSIVIALAKLAEFRDADTGRHLDRVTRYCTLLAKRMRESGAYAPLITNQFLVDLEKAMPLHDIGKVAVPDQILRKPGPLTREEMEIMRTHADLGADTIRSVADGAPGAHFLVLAEQIARSHHEWFDGRGYPKGFAGELIPLAARIAAVADVYDALTTKRVYKDAISHARAVTIISDLAGRQFDPGVISAFLACESEFRRLAAELADAPTENVGPSSKTPKPRPQLATLGRG